jgi:hypothetical protein
MQEPTNPSGARRISDIAANYAAVGSVNEMTEEIVQIF